MEVLFVIVSVIVLSVVFAAFLAHADGKFGAHYEDEAWKKGTGTGTGTGGSTSGGQEDNNDPDVKV
jgi:hypothetical protein